MSYIINIDKEIHKARLSHQCYLLLTVYNVNTQEPSAEGRWDMHGHAIILLDVSSRMYTYRFAP